MQSEARLICDELLKGKRLGRMFNQRLSSSWRDLTGFIQACLNEAGENGDDELADRAANVIDVAAADSPAFDTEFPDNYGLILKLGRDLEARFKRGGIVGALESAYTAAVAERRQLHYRYYKLRPVIADLLHAYSADDSSHDLNALANTVLTRCCQAVMDLLDANRALLSLRKSMAYDSSNSTYSLTGRLIRLVANHSQVCEYTGTDDEQRRLYDNEVQFLLRDETGTAAAGIYSYPEYSAAVDEGCPVLWYANAEHAAMLFEQARTHFSPMILLTSYLFAHIHHQLFVRKNKLPDAAELENIDVDKYYVPQVWQCFNGGYFEYEPRMVFPLEAGGVTIGILNVDNFGKPLGRLELDTRAKEVVRDFEIYRRQRKIGLVKHFGGWLRREHPELLPEILAAAPDATKDEDKFLAYRGLDMIDSRTEVEFFTYLDREHGIRFKPDDDDLDHLLSFFNSKRPVSRQATVFAEMLSKDISAQLATLNAMRTAETAAHHNALTHVSKERSLTSRTLRHEGINKLTALRNTVSDAESYLRQLRSTWQGYVEDFGAFSDEHIPEELYGELGEIIEPLYTVMGRVDEGIERVLRASRIGDELNNLFLRHKGGEFRKEYVVIHEVLDEVIERYNALYFEGPNITITRNYGNPDQLAYCFRELMITVFCTYLDNAIEALRKVSDRERIITITTTSDEETIHFEFSDTGIGFWQNQELMDNPMTLYSSYSSKGGREHGVGLRIVNEIITDMSFHNGVIDVPRSEPGLTTFGFTIPVTESRVVRLRG